MIGGRGVLAVLCSGLLVVAAFASDGVAQDEDGFQVQVIPGGKGSVVLSAEGFETGECTLPAAGVSSDACTSRYPAGTRVRLKAISGGGPFRGWSAASCRSGTTCLVNVTRDIDIVARFDQVVVTLAKDAGGTVRTADRRIDCGPGCTADDLTVKQGTPVTVTASSAGEFKGWSGPCNTTGPTCRFPAVFNLTVGAGFLEEPQAPVGDPGELSVRVARKAGGTVYAPAPKGGGNAIMCPAVCASDGYRVYDTLRFRAVANRGYRHTGWSQGCAGAPRFCALPVTRATSISAKFRRR